MRMFATFLCLFLLLLFFGTLTYVYIMWRHYWIRVEQLNRELERHNYHHAGGMVRGKYPGGSGMGGAARRRAEKSEDNHIVSAMIPEDKLLAHVEHYETQVGRQRRNEVGKNNNFG